MRPKVGLPALFLLAFVLFPLDPAQGATIQGKISVYNKVHKVLHERPDAVVYIEEAAGNKDFHPASSPEMASEGMSFIPSVLPVLVGTTVRFTNNDDVLHNVFSLSKTKPFDLGLFKGDQVKEVLFDQVGLVRVYCNIHQDMRGTILVLGNPYFARVGPDGKYSIRDVPPGKYKLVCWYRYGEAVSKEVALKNSGAAGKVNFDVFKTLQETKHKNKWGKEYKEKY